VIENRVIGAGEEAGVEAEEVEIKEDAVVDRANSMDQEVAEGVLVEDQLRVRYILIRINMDLQSKNTIPLKLEIQACLTSNLALWTWGEGCTRHLHRAHIIHLTGAVLHLN